VGFGHGFEVEVDGVGMMMDDKTKQKNGKEQLSV
jgi:hypothetical protein